MYNISGVIIPPKPDGNNPDYLSSSADVSGHQIGLWAASTILMIMGTVVMVLRFVARRGPKGHGVGADDFLILPAWLFAMGTAICCLTSISSGNGRHFSTLMAVEKASLLKTMYALLYIWATALLFTKLSTLMFYHRLFGRSKGFTICMVLVLLNWTTTIIGWASACSPTSYGWISRIYPSIMPYGHCMNTKLFLIFTGVINLVLDFIVVLLPVPVVWKLDINMVQKLGVLGIFCMGGFVCIASIVRMVFVNRTVRGEDLSLGNLFIWSAVEPFIGMIAACLPTFAPLVRSCLSHRGRSDVESSSWKEGNQIDAYLKNQGDDIELQNRRSMRRISGFGNGEAILSLVVNEHGRVVPKSENKSPCSKNMLSSCGNTNCIYHPKEEDGNENEEKVFN